MDCCALESLALNIFFVQSFTFYTIYICIDYFELVKIFIFRNIEIYLKDLFKPVLNFIKTNILRYIIISL